MAATKWKLVTATAPCPICKHGDWCQCSDDGAIAMCMRIAEGAIKSATNRSGADYHIHELIPREKRKGAKPVTAEPTGERADADTLHAVNSALLRECSYSERHRLDLLRRKLPAGFGMMGYGTLPDKPWKAVAKLREKFSDEVLLKVPGIVVKVNKKGERYITIAGKPGMLVPVRDEAERIVGVKVRMDGTDAKGKYRWLTSRKVGKSKLPFDGPGPGTPAHCPLLLTKVRPVKMLRITEGPLKADVANANSDVPTIAADSVGGCIRAVEMARALGAETVRLAFDMDRTDPTKPQVAGAFVKSAAALDELKIDVEIETWDPKFKGIDDALVAGAPIDVIRGEDVLGYLLLMETIHKKKADSGDGRTEIEITPDEHHMNDEACIVLARDTEIYQRGGTLVGIRRGELRDDGIQRPEDMPRIVTLKAPTVRDRLSRLAKFGTTITNPETGEEKFERKPIPQKVVDAVMDRGHWDGIRPLVGVVSAPVLRRDGSILNTPGYDPATCLIFEPLGETFPVVEKPTKQDAIAAAGRLLELVADFPFALPAHKSAWLAGLLTPPARYAFDGPAPLFLFDANVRGAGKTLLAELIALILTGADFSRMSNPQDDTEARKLITSLVLFGDALVLIDNVTGLLGCAALDAALTGTVWKDRRLGANEVIVGMLLMVWFASGNNVVLNGDTTRRTCQCRLESPEERPEERTAFKIPNLTSYVKQQRPALLVDVLTILSAYCLAGRPQAGLKAWGSFDGWSNLVRQAVVWIGLEDPGATRQELAERSDRDAEQLRELIAGWEEIDLDCSGLTCADALQRLQANHNAPRLRNVLANLYDLKPGELPGAKKLGNRLRQLRGRACGGKTLDDSRENRNGVKVWRVVNLASRNGMDRSAGSADSAGSATALLTRDGSRTNGHMHDAYAHANIAGTDPAEPADPAARCPTFVAAHFGDLLHKRHDCRSTTGWRHINGQEVCFTCWPPTDLAAVAREGAA